jgi:GxxExxY protein
MKLKKRNLKAERQISIPIVYDGLRIENAFKSDIIVENLVINELKSVENILPVHAKQLLTYLRLIDRKLGMLINFGAPVIKDGIKRIVNNL